MISVKEMTDNQQLSLQAPVNTQHY